MLKPQQVKKLPIHHRAHDGCFSVLGGLTLKQKRSRKWLPLPVEYHEHLAWALATCRWWAIQTRGNQDYGLRRIADIVECIADDIAQSDTKYDWDRKWNFYYKYHGNSAGGAVEPVKALIMTLAVLLSIPDLEKYDPRLQLMIDIIDFGLGKHHRATQRTKH